MMKMQLEEPSSPAIVVPSIELERLPFATTIGRYADRGSCESAAAVPITYLQGSPTPAIAFPQEVRRGSLVHVEPVGCTAIHRCAELRVTCRIASGAFSDVYRVEHAELGLGDEPPWAMKVLKSEFAEDPLWVERFGRRGWHETCVHEAWVTESLARNPESK